MKFTNPFRPAPAPPGFGTGKVIPEDTAPLLSKLVFEWLSPFLGVGFSRPLEKEDFWELPEPDLTGSITDRVEQHFYARCPPDKRPHHLSHQIPDFQEDVHDDTGDTEKDLDIKRSDSPASATAAPTPDESAEVTGKLKRDARSKWSFFSRKQKTGSAYDESLFKAILKTFSFRLSLAGVLKLLSDTLKTTTPLLNKVLLTWLAESYAWFRTPEEQRAALGQKQPRGIGYGIGLAVALFVMQEVSSLMNNHYMQKSFTNGLLIRSGIIGSIFRKSLRLSGRARIDHGVGKITTMISADASRLDRFSGFAHNLWVAPIQIIIGVGLLLGNLGYSALVGLGVLLLTFPIQFILVKVMFSQRKKGVKITDTRIRLTTEVLQGIRLIKFYAWEAFYTHQIGDLRTREINTIKKQAIARSVLMAFVTFVPVLAAILSFITYALSGHDLSVATIFSSLQLFNVIRMPLIFFPLVLSSLSDAMVALNRISAFLTAEELSDSYKIEQGRDIAVEFDGDFTWETVPSSIVQAANSGFAGRGKGKGCAVVRGGSGGKTKEKGGVDGSKDGQSRSRSLWKFGSKPKGQTAVLPVSKQDIGAGEIDQDDDQTIKKASFEKEMEDEKPFELKGLRMAIPRGAFVGIVGRVGSGKSSVLQALIGEMRKTRGEVVIGGSIAYVPQTPWIKNATLRENVLFGREDDEGRFREVIKACSLEHDLEVLPNGEETEIGEKGINLSGGQKARVSLARAAYADADIALLDDPLSAVDAYVGRAILENCLTSGPLARKTRILVTHALHVLDKTDYIYVMDEGIIIEEGTYEDLMKNSIVFARLIEEHGNLEQEDQGAHGVETRPKAKDEKDEETGHEGAAKKGPDLMQAEERNTGAVTWDVYKHYLRFAGGLIWAPIVIALLVLTQGAQVANNLFLGFWTSQSVHGFRQGDYMAVYASLGVASAIFTFLLSLSFAILSLYASLNMFKTALRGVLRSPTSFFDTTPIGRMLSRLSKDQDTLDNELSMTLNQFLNTFSSILGTVALVFYTFPLLGILFGPMAVMYYLVSMYYRRSSVETKRLDSLMRSALYASYSESLTGLSTIRAFKGQEQSIRTAEHGLDMENRAYYMTISIQRWLSVRLDLFGNILIFGIGLFAAGFRRSVDPSKIGVVLSYTLGITQVFSEMISQFAQNEQNMNAVERVLHYTELLPEGDAVKPNDPPPSWPPSGGIAFKNVELAYRPGLPLVLKDVSFDVKPGEKVGIVGRTGAGKSSLLQALFRIVEPHSGKIEIDGLDIHDVGLDTLRNRLALVPQDSTLFLGTLRENLDPQGTKTDAELISALQRAWLLPREGSTPNPAAEAKFSLNATIGDEGSNYSAGEKQLLALCRALVKNSRIIVLDEATSSVDVETDAKLQRTIQTEFSSSTLLCIAHRLNTIAYYDRVLVMDGGKVAEFDTVLNLFDKEDSIFRSLCDEANLTRADIQRIRADHGALVGSVAPES
ncbi:multidrug resistance-associated ABC transporter [Macrolepiota fuliginosa MF-IS2]|uniref:Multidrug resistance-associated ABC transporter n=1 Tax=Macrolepiota fuliginosa MF-IS2 TaxID=1400762 RepID=A0A9P5XC68_9AGAR|nr:multidrug resistance-associated ABC transporter [Macrolepiota fuliginosa MF-IS2]